MGREIERKFLVSGDFKKYSIGSAGITQGYLSSVPDRVVRIRIENDRGFITIKGPSKAGGIERYEWETEIPCKDALELLHLCEPGIIEKKRYIVQAGDHLFEVDEFLGKNRGLVIAEIELSEKDEKFTKPGWLGEEVTGEARYYNSMLSKHPYESWK